MADVPAHRAGGRAIARGVFNGGVLAQGARSRDPIPRLFRNASSQESK